MPNLILRLNNIYLRKRSEAGSIIYDKITANLREADSRYMLNTEWRNCHAYWHAIDKELLREYILWMCNIPLYFPNSKYKGRIVQDVILTDRSYCEWYVQNCRAYDTQELRVHHYITKTLSNRVYPIQPISTMGLPILRGLLPDILFSSSTLPLVKSFVQELYDNPDTRITPTQQLESQLEKGQLVWTL